MKKTGLFLPMLLLLLVCASTGCDKILQKQGAPDMAFDRAAPAPMKAKAGFAGAALEAESEGDTANVTDQKIIRSANIRIQVNNATKAAEKARTIVEDMGGLVTNSSSYEDDAGNTSVSITLKVPSGKLDEAMAKLTTLGDVRQEDISARDVTEQYVDLEARLGNAKRVEKRLLDLLDNKTAKLEDMIKVEKELGRVRENIESMVARKRYFDSRVSLSTIEAVFFEPRGFGRGIFEPISGLLQRSLSAFTASIALLIVFLSAAVPWFILMIALGWLFLRLLRMWLRHKRAMKAKKETRD